MNKKTKVLDEIRCKNDLPIYGRGYIQGTFDMFHIGHLNLIRRAAARCEYLIVGVVSDEFNLANKNRKPCIPFEDRAAIVAAVGVVAEVIKVEKGHSVIDTWRIHPYDCYFSGDDHVGAEFVREMHRHGIATVFFPYTQKISSTKLREQLQKGEEKTARRKEILFLPYKASMWDSLESVWEAARADENCHAVVVPIPYADLNVDGSIREWHYEWDKFPKGVPVMDWRQYDVAQIRPDVIYIHNPYDDGNRITMVEPSFFSRNLRSYTDMLVYIPYFAWTGVWPNNHLNLPCYSEVDKIIVQSPCYKILVAEGAWEEDNVGLVDVMPPGKIAVLGSPKLDRMAKQEAFYGLPAGWRQKMGRKKTVLYNTTVSPMLTFGRLGIKKMWQVYHAMQRHEEMAFIWRPHPLLESMLESQRPELMEDFRRWKAAMLDLPQVIYDDTPDLARAVALSDGYVGENSSVVQLFAMTGKPIFYNNFLLGEEGDKNAVMLGSNMAVEGDNLYFWTGYWHALCKMNITDGRVEVLYHWQASAYPVGDYGDIVKMGEHLILVPVRAKNILDYNISTGEVKHIEYKNPLLAGNFSAGIVWQGKVILPGSMYPSILIYEVESGEISYIDMPDEIKELRHEGHLGLCGRPCIIDDILYAPVVNGNKVLALNLRDRTTKIYTIGPKEAAYGYATAYADNVWLAPHRGGPLLVWNPPTGVYKFIDQFPKGFISDSRLGIEETIFFGDCLACGKYWWLLPYCANMILRLNMETGEIEPINTSFDLAQPSNGRYLDQCKVWAMGGHGDTVFMQMGADCKIHCFNGTSGQEIKTLQPMIPQKYIQDTARLIDERDFREYIAEGQNLAIMEDGINCTHDAFFAYVQSGVHDREKQKQAFAAISVNIDGSCGQKIHEYVMNELANKREG